MPYSPGGGYPKGPGGGIGGGSGVVDKGGAAGVKAPEVKCAEQSMSLNRRSSVEWDLENVGGEQPLWSSTSSQSSASASMEAAEAAVQLLCVSTVSMGAVCVRGEGYIAVYYSGRVSAELVVSNSDHLGRTQRGVPLL